MIVMWAVGGGGFTLEFGGVGLELVITTVSGEDIDEFRGIELVEEMGPMTSGVMGRSTTHTSYNS